MLMARVTSFAFRAEELLGRRAVVLHMILRVLAALNESTVCLHEHWLNLAEIDAFHDLTNSQALAAFN